MDQPQAFARMKPGTTQPLRPGADRLGRKVWIKQPHGGVKMHETGTMADDPLLQMAHDPAQLEALLAQSVHDVRLGHRNSPSQNIKVQDGNRTIRPSEQRAWWRQLHDTGYLQLVSA